MPVKLKPREIGPTARPPEPHSPARRLSFLSCKLPIAPCNTHDIPKPRWRRIVQRHRCNLLKAWVLDRDPGSGTDLALGCLSEINERGSSKRGKAMNAAA